MQEQIGKTGGGKFCLINKENFALLLDLIFNFDSISKTFETFFALFESRNRVGFDEKNFSSVFKSKSISFVKRTSQSEVSQRKID